MTPEQEAQLREAVEKHNREILQAHFSRQKAINRAVERQQDIDTVSRRQYAVIVAVDASGGFAKNGSIPWNYPADLSWFKKRTTGHVVIMGKNTYAEISSRTRNQTPPTEESVVSVDDQIPNTSKVIVDVGEKAHTSILPGRKCFVCTTDSKKRMELLDATGVSGIADVENYLTDEDDEKTIFIIGGERLYREGITLANTVYLTAINQTFGCDKYFPVDYLQEHFTLSQKFINEKEPDLRFLVWKRKPGS